MCVGKHKHLNTTEEKGKVTNFLFGDTALIESDYGRTFRRKLVSRIIFPKDKLEGICFKIATSLKEKEMARKLVHDSYVALSYIEPLAPGMQFSLFQLLPGTTTFIAMRDEKILGTISLIEDSEIGLPIDELHKTDIDKVRHDGRRIAEVGSLAVDKSQRDKGIHFILFNVAFQWARRHRCVDDLVVWALPRSRTFYKNMLFFKQFGQGVKDEAMNGIITSPLGESIDVLYRQYRRSYDNDQHIIELMGKKLTLFEFLKYSKDNPLFSFWKAPPIKAYPYQLTMPPALTAQEIRQHIRNCNVDIDGLQASHKIMLGQLCSA